MWIAELSESSNLWTQIALVEILAHLFECRFNTNQNLIRTNLLMSNWVINQALSLLILNDFILNVLLIRDTIQWFNVTIESDSYHNILTINNFLDRVKDNEEWMNTSLYK